MVEYVVVFSTLLGVIIALITIYDRLIEKRKKEKIIDDVKKIAKVERFYLKWKAIVEILNFEGDAHYIHNIVYVNMGDQTAYSTWHSIWGSSITSETDLNLKAYDAERSLVTKVLTETPSFRRVGIDFPEEGVEPKERYSYVFEYDFPRQFGNLKDGWYEFSVDSMTANLEIEIKLPKNAILQGVPICYILKDGAKFPMEELQPKRKGNHFLINFKTKKVVANQVFRIEFKATSKL